MIQALVLDLTGVYYTFKGLTKFEEWMVSKGLTKKEFTRIFYFNDYHVAAKTDYTKENEWWGFFYNAIEKLSDLHPIDLDPEDHLELLQEFAKHEERDEALFQFCQKLRKDRGMTIGICSNTHLAHMQSRIMNGVEPVGVDFQVLSFREGTQKPEKKMFARVIEEARCKPNQILYVDDNEKHVKGAIDAGLKAMLYTDFASFKKEVKKDYPYLLESD